MSLSGPVCLGLEAFNEGWGTNSELGKVKVEVEVQLEGTMQGYRESDDAGELKRNGNLKLHPMCSAPSRAVGCCEELEREEQV